MTKTHFRHLALVAIVIVFAALGGAAGLTATGCGDESASQDVAPSAVPLDETVQPTATPATTPTAEREWSFRGQRGITTAFAPADLALYESLLPAPFEVPETPMVVMAVMYYYDVTLPLTPYHEGYVLLQCEYDGRTGWYVLTMPVDDETANAGGRVLGFPKYVADKIDLEETDGVWGGSVAYQGRTVMSVTFTPDAGAEPVTASSDDPGPSIFLLIPPAEGPTVDEVNMDLAGPRQTLTTSGTATVTAEPGEPWAGLLPASDIASWATFEEMTGDWILVATQH